jgi:hypothetical protein
LGFQVFTLCPAPGIDTTGGVSARTCLTPPKGGGVSARADRRGDAQETRDTAVSFGSFSFPQKKMNKPINKIMPWIGRTSQGPPPEVEGLDQN